MTETGTVYELAYLVTPLLPEQALAEEVARIKSGIESLGATILLEEQPKMRYLAYTIVKKIANKNTRFNEAYFGWVRFKSAPEDAAKVDAHLKKYDSVIRSLFMVAPKEEVKEKKSAATSEEALPTEKADGLSDLELDREIDQMIAA